ncbi:MAG TPA: CcmD family protein [Candidatus Binatia bacterium]|nr:CcmD family protein [Candidatus Binatia bacterium]
MRAWAFVAAAYGIVWGAILMYLYSLKHRYHRAAAELEQLRSMEVTAGDEKK